MIVLVVALAVLAGIVGLGILVMLVLWLPIALGLRLLILAVLAAGGVWLWRRPGTPSRLGGPWR